MCISYIWGLAPFSSLYRIKHTRWHTCLDEEVMHIVRCRNTVCRLRQHQVASLPHKLGQTSLFTACLGFICFYFYCDFFNTYFSSWMALSSEAPQPFSDPSLPCHRVPGAPAHISPWKRKSFASLPSAHLDLPLVSWASGRHGHAADRLCFSVST